MQWKELTGMDVQIESELSASTVTYWRLLGGQKSGQKSGQKGGQKSKAADLTTREKILAIIREKPKATREMLVSELNISASAIQKHINVLKKEGHIERIGAAKGGYWKVN